MAFFARVLASKPCMQSERQLLSAQLPMRMVSIRGSKASTKGKAPNVHGHLSHVLPGLPVNADVLVQKAPEQPAQQDLRTAGQPRALQMAWVSDDFPMDSISINFEPKPETPS